MSRLDVVIDTRTTRLTAAARAVQAAEHLPKESARSLVALSRGTRLYLEANQSGLASRTLHEIDLLMSTAEDKELKQVFTGLVNDVRKALRRTPE